MASSDAMARAVAAAAARSGEGKKRLAATVPTTVAAAAAPPPPAPPRDIWVLPLLSDGRHVTGAILLRRVAADGSRVWDIVRRGDALVGGGTPGGDRDPQLVALRALNAALCGLAPPASSFLAAAREAAVVAPGDGGGGGGGPVAAARLVQRLRGSDGRARVYAAHVHWNEAEAAAAVLAAVAPRFGPRDARGLHPVSASVLPFDGLVVVQPHPRGGHEEEDAAAAEASDGEEGGGVGGAAEGGGGGGGRLHASTRLRIRRGVPSHTSPAAKAVLALAGAPITTTT